MKPFLSVVIPVSEGSNNLPLVLVGVDKYLESRDFSAEILVVDYSSDVLLSGALEKFSGIFPSVRFMRSESNGGRGGAAREGMRKARGNYRLLINADGSVSPEEFDAMPPLFKEGYDVVVCSGRSKGSVAHRGRSLRDRVLGTAIDLMARIFLPSGVGDARRLGKCMTENAVSVLFETPPLEKDEGFDFELLSLAKIRGLREKEIPVKHGGGGTTLDTARSCFAALRGILAVRFNLWFGRYPR